MWACYLGIVVECSAVNMLLIIATRCEEAQWIEVFVPRLLTASNETTSVEQFWRQVNDRLVRPVVLPQVDCTQIRQLRALEGSVDIIQSLQQWHVQPQTASKLWVHFGVHLWPNNSNPVCSGVTIISHEYTMNEKKSIKAKAQMFPMYAHCLHSYTVNNSYILVRSKHQTNSRGVAKGCEESGLLRAAPAKGWHTINCKNARPGIKIHTE